MNPYFTVLYFYKNEFYLGKNRLWESKWYYYLKWLRSERFPCTFATGLLIRWYTKLWWCKTRMQRTVLCWGNSSGFIWSPVEGVFWKLFREYLDRMTGMKWKERKQGKSVKVQEKEKVDTVKNSGTIKKQWTHASNWGCFGNKYWNINDDLQATLDCLTCP